MTPVRGWTEHDYYTASRRARRLGERRLAQQQIQGVLDEADAGAVGLVEPACPPESSPPGGLTSGDRPAEVVTVAPSNAIGPVRSALRRYVPNEYDGPDASSCLGARRGQEGA